MQIIIDARLPQWQGNLHAHTTQSDGRLDPQTVVSLYEAAGYDFLALTDHRKVTDPASLRTSLVLLPGIELDYQVQGRHLQTVHLIGVGMDGRLMEEPHVLETPQQGIDAVRAHGGQVIFAHPAWSLNEPQVLAGLRGLSAVEIYNHVSDAPWNAQRGDASVLLDECFSDGCLLPLVAADDSHFYNGDQCHASLMVSAPERSRESILDALAKGRVYASEGPRIEEMSIQDGAVSLRCSPCDRIIFYSNAFYSRDRVICGQGITEARYVLRPMETFIRAEITDARGRRAWSSPAKIR